MLYHRKQWPDIRMHCIKQNQIDTAKVLRKNESDVLVLKREYHQLHKKYIKAYNDLLDKSQPSVNLSILEVTEIIKESFCFWESKKLKTYAYCIMPNHVHWVVKVFEKDINDKPVYLQDIMHSVKRYSANKINKLLKRIGALWQKESFDTTIRNDVHLMRAIQYTLNNPVKAGFVNSWEEWPGCGRESFKLP